MPPPHQIGPLPRSPSQDLSPSNTQPPLGPAGHHTLPALLLAATGRLLKSTLSYTSTSTACPTGPYTCSQMGRILPAQTPASLRGRGQDISAAVSSSFPALVSRPDPPVSIDAVPKRAQLRPLMRNRPRAQTQHIHTGLTPLKRVPDLSTDNGSPPDLPNISSVEDWAYLMHTHTHTPISHPSRTNIQPQRAQQYMIARRRDP